MQEYCYRCMRPLQGTPFCPQCGYNNAAAPSAAAPYHLPRGTVLSNRYLVGNVIGEGGFGITYIGLDTTLSKRVAIKEFYPSGAANRTNSVSEAVVVTQGKETFFSRGVERFLFEAQNIAAFSEEEGIVYVLDYFQANGTAYIVMEYIDGETLKDYVNRRGCFSPNQIIPLMLPVMRSLSVMHAKGIIHRDISPDNIMFTKRGKMKLMDFGSARYYTNAERQMSVILKQGFAPEEQYRQNGQQGPFTDVYALCATIYACITGVVPVSSLDRLANDTLRAPSQLGVSIQPYQERALMHGLALHRENRTPDMETLMREFSAPAVMPQTQPYSPAQPKKSKAPLVIALVAAVVLIGGGIVAGIIAFGGNKGGDGTRGATTPQSRASQSSLQSSSGASSGTESSAVSSAVSSAASSRPASSSNASQTESSSSESSAVPDAAHALVNENGTFIMEDDRINTSDIRAEQQIKNYMSLDKTDASTDEFKYSYFISGNTLVLQYRYVIELDSTQIANLKTAATALETNENAIAFKETLREKTEVEDVQVVYAYFTIDGDLITAVMVDE